MVIKSREGLNKVRIDASMELAKDMTLEYKNNIHSKENSSIIKKMIIEYERNLIGK